ncbi:MAG: 4Fe-4S binding protein [Candidatus Korarchaeota archaeon]|nr:4Fe-4S binding protein [Candidatus Korarchaeota archaeon]
MITLAVVQVDFHVILEVNKEKCIGCGICVDVCPSNI